MLKRSEAAFGDGGRKRCSELSIVELSWVLQWKVLLIFREEKYHFSCAKCYFSLGILKIFFYFFT